MKQQQFSFLFDKKRFSLQQSVQSVSVPIKNVQDGWEIVDYVWDTEHEEDDDG